MNRILICAAFAWASAASIFISYASANTKTDVIRVPNVNNNLQFPSSRWRVVKHAFRVHIPQNNKPMTQIIVDAPSTVAVSNDIDVLDEKGQKININVSANGRRIIIAFPETVISNTYLLIEFNKVKQPINSAASVYNLSAKVVGSDTEIRLGVAQFPTF